ncbi:TonB-dependent receptor [Microbulbifer magnicolonia]|uniref:TonB-dependent receptor n=1 Tax=Microbulbifer magnicolonia TaxID=3109744 RepID=UPI002B40F7E1|nr:TonB-dependent receptor [Microbulbifer sp. GG15]
MHHPFVRTPISAVVAAVALGILSSPVIAQNQRGASEIEEVAVVGSRIKRSDEVVTSPVQTLSADDLRVSGSVSIGETLQELPSVGSSLNGNGSAGTSHGSSSLNLRNLGENRSLVLVDGHRWVNGAGTRGFRDFVDLNTIPQAIVERVEVLQDGATAVYGADAIAGVVNIHTYRDYDGADLKVYYGAAGEGDRETASLDYLWGTNYDGGNLMVAVSHTDQKPIFTQDRELTAVPLNGLSAGTIEGVFRESNLASVLDGYASAGVTRDPGSDGSVPASWRAVDAEADQFNRYYNNYVVGPLQRTSVFARNRTELTDNIEFSVEALYNRRESDQLFSSAPPVIRGSRGFVIANDPLVNPFGVEFSGSDFRVDNYFDDVGQRRNAQEVDTLRLAAGLEGELRNGWSWDAFVSWAQNEADFISYNQIDLDRLALGLRACDTSAIGGDIADIAAGCVPVNLFEPLTGEMVDYINFTGRDRNSAEQRDFTFNVTGDLFTLPAGEVAFAAGVEYREESGEDRPDSYVQADPRVNSYQTTTSAPRDGTMGEYNLGEVYAELSVPLLRGMSLVQDLTLDLATRYSDYSTFGDTTNSKVGLAYRPVDDLLLRGTWAQGFRAPSILEMFEGARSTFLPVNDPCNGGGEGLVGCAAVPDSYVQQGPNVPGEVGGNRNLQPETSENTSFGLVYTPSYLEGASLTLDWYGIAIDDTISTFGAQNLLELCATTGQRCDYVSRAANGEILNIVDGPINLNRTEVKGMDLVARYGMETALGGLDLTFNASRLLDLTQESTLPDGSILVEDKVGTAASRESFPEWRASLSAKLSADKWSASYTARYIGTTEESVADESYGIPAVIYHNVSGSYDVQDNLNLKVGINNLTDKQPPVSLTNLNINFDQNTYNPVGRFLYMQVNYSFDS